MVDAARFMKIIHFMNGQELEDFHLNSMQNNFAKALKAKTTQDKYDTYLLISPYNYYFYESFADEQNKSAESTSKLNVNELEFYIESGDWITKMMTLPQQTDEIMFVGSVEENRAEGAYVEFYYRTSTEGDWTIAATDTAITLPNKIEYIQVMARCYYVGTIRPRLNDFALLVK